MIACKTGACQPLAAPSRLAECLKDAVFQCFPPRSGPAACNAAHLDRVFECPIPIGGRQSQPQRFYVEQLATMRERELNTLYVNFEHLLDYDQVSSLPLPLHCCWPTHFPCSAPLHHPRPHPVQSLSSDIVDAFYRMEPYLRRAVSDFVREHLDTYAERDDGTQKEFWVSFFNLEQSDRLRSLRSDKIGVLTQFVGTVTRTTEVRPELFLGTFRCVECMGVVKAVEQQFKFTQPTRCPQQGCSNL